jgi:hypothetical protein
VASIEQGARDLETVAKRLKATGRGDLRKQLLAGIRKEGKETVKDIKRSAAESLPHRGGLAELVSRSSYGVRTRLSGNGVGVRIQGTSRSVKSLRALNAGRLRHPVYGNRKVWAEQHVEPGWFDKPIERDAPQIRRGIDRVLSDTAAKIERGI